MLVRLSQLVAWTMWAVAVAFVIAGLVTARAADLFGALTVSLPGLAFATAGAFLVTRLPGHLVGWLLVAGGFCLSVSAGAAGLATYGLIDQPGSVPGAIWFAWVSQWLWAPAIGTIIGLSLVYPTGRLLSRRWRPLAVLAVADIGLLAFGSATSPWPPGQLPASNPLVVPAFANGPIADAITGAILLSSMFAAFLALVTLVRRYRRAEGIERLQLKWFVFVASLSVPLFLFSAVLFGAGGLAGEIASLASFLAFVGFAALPIAIGVAVLRYRLYDIDQIINRTIVYGALTAILAGSYAALVGLLQRFFVAITGSTSDAAVVLTTLLVVSLFTPVKNRLQGLVDRRFKTTDRTRPLLELASAVEARLSPLDPAVALSRLLQVASATFGATSGSTWLGSGASGSLVATMNDGPAPDVAGRATSIQASGLEVAAGIGAGAVRLVLGPRPRGVAYDDADRSAVLLTINVIVRSVADDRMRGPRTIRPRSDGEVVAGSHGQPGPGAFVIGPENLPHPDRPPN